MYKHHPETAGPVASNMLHLQVQLWQALLKSLEARDAPVMDAVAHTFEALLGKCCLPLWCLLPVASGALDRVEWPEALLPVWHMKAQQCRHTFLSY